MAEKKPSGTHSSPPPSACNPSHNPSHHNGRVLSACPIPHSNDISAGQGSCSPKPSLASRNPLRQILTLSLRSGTGCSPTRFSNFSPRIGQKHADSNGPRIPATSDKTRSAEEVSSSQTEELLDLIVEAQRQRMDDQRAPGPAVVCGSCCLGPSQDFYNMLIHYQSRRMEDQRCWMPDVDEGSNLVPDSQEEG